MTIQAKINTSTARVIEILENLPHVTYVAEAGEAIEDVTNFVNVEDVPNEPGDYIFSSGEIIYTPVGPPADVVTNAKAGVDIAASNARRRYISRGDGQEMTYLRKEENAVQHKTDGYPADLTNYPWIQAEVNATGLSATQATDLILAHRDAWLTIGVAIEEARRLGKVNIDGATNTTEVATARDAATAALDAL